jgi:mevalonate kinase
MGLKCYRAPTKVILLGEHFVVRGVPGLAAAIGLWSYACAEEAEGPGVIEARGLGISCKLGECSRLGLGGLERILEAVGGGLRLVVWSEAPIGAGLGSSGSVSVAAAAAALSVAHGGFTLEEVERLAWEAERIHHGRPSGIDHTTALYGGVLRFDARGVFTRIEAPRLHLVIADTGVPRSTKEAVQRVLERLASHRKALDYVYLAAWHLVEEATVALREGQIEHLGELMDIAHGLLYALGVSTPEIETLVWAARRAGALGAKLTGAGLGGVVIALAGSRPEAERIEAALRGAGARWVRSVEAGVEGLSEARVLA